MNQAIYLLLQLACSLCFPVKIIGANSYKISCVVKSITVFWLVLQYCGVYLIISYPPDNTVKYAPPLTHTQKCLYFKAFLVDDTSGSQDLSSVFLLW